MKECMQERKKLSPDEVDALLARVLLVFAKRGRELRRGREEAVHLLGNAALENKTEPATPIAEKPQP